MSRFKSAREEKSGIAKITPPIILTFRPFYSNYTICIRTHKDILLNTGKQPARHSAWQGLPGRGFRDPFDTGGMGVMTAEGNEAWKCWRYHRCQSQRAVLLNSQRSSPCRATPGNLRA